MAPTQLKLTVLPTAQRTLWPKLEQTPKHFVLYGGTALALRLGHRESIDFDFFSNQSFFPLQLLRSIDYLKDQPVIQQSENTLSCRVETKEGPVMISLFGGLGLKQIEPPDISDENKIAIASLLDIFGMKCATIPQRAEIKDYLDIHAILTQAHLTLSEGLSAARAIYGNQYNPVQTLQALSYFEDLSGSLTESQKKNLLSAVKCVDLSALPKLQAIQPIGAGI